MPRSSRSSWPPWCRTLPTGSGPPRPPYPILQECPPAPADDPPPVHLHPGRQEEHVLSVPEVPSRMPSSLPMTTSVQILHDRDFRVPVQKVIDHYVRFKVSFPVSPGLSNAFRTSSGSWNIPSTRRILAVFVPGKMTNSLVFVSVSSSILLGSPLSGTPHLEIQYHRVRAPTADSCDPKNPTFPQMGTSKRPYFVELKADGQPEWSFEFHKPAVELWDNLVSG